MEQLDRLAATRAVEFLDFCETNKRLARYWLSLWDGEAPPSRSALHPARMKDLLPGIAILECLPGKSVHCRLAGSAIVMGLGVDITGHDMIEMTPPKHRAARLELNSRVAEGAVARCIKELRSRFGGLVTVEEIYLPLGGVDENGVRPILYHANWRPSTMDRSAGEILNGYNTAVSAEFFPLAIQEHAHRRAAC